MGGDLAAMVFGAATPLALRLATDALGFPPERHRARSLRKSEYGNSYRVPYRVLASGAVRSRRTGGGALLTSASAVLRDSGALASGYHAENGSVSARPLTTR